MTTRRWGKAGVRLSPTAARQRELSHLADRAQQDAGRKASRERAHRKWSEGLVIPAHITCALDAANLHGPDVDTACGAQEPDVDLWEAGKLYPTFDQILLLAELTGKNPDWFMAPIRTLSIWETSMRFHVSHYERSRLFLPVYRFTERALNKAARIGVRV